MASSLERAEYINWWQLQSGSSWPPEVTFRRCCSESSSSSLSFSASAGMHQVDRTGPGETLMTFYISMVLTDKYWSHNTGLNFQGFYETSTSPTTTSNPYEKFWSYGRSTSPTTTSNPYEEFCFSCIFSEWVRDDFDLKRIKESTVRIKCNMWTHFEYFCSVVRHDFMKRNKYLLPHYSQILWIDIMNR